MKASELRIGNWVSFQGKAERLYEFDNSLTLLEFDTSTGGTWGAAVPHEGLTPIPLTEEWLLKLGFEKTEALNFDNTTAYEIPSWGRVALKDGELQSDQYYFLDGLTQPIKYVHQLQNLYHALTGNELSTTTP